MSRLYYTLHVSMSYMTFVSYNVVIQVACIGLCKLFCSPVHSVQFKTMIQNCSIIPTEAFSTILSAMLADYLLAYSLHPVDYGCII